MLNKIKLQKSNLFLLVSIFLWGQVSCERINITKNWLTTNRKDPYIMYLNKLKTICFLNSVTYFVLFRRKLLTLFFFTLTAFCVHSNLTWCVLCSETLLTLILSVHWHHVLFFSPRVLQNISFRLRDDFLRREKYSSGPMSLGS